MEKKQTLQMKSSTKCLTCKKKCLFLISCQCGNNFCLSCRYPEKHNCTYNFKEKCSVELVKNNPKITGEKINKI